MSAQQKAARLEAMDEMIALVQFEHDVHERCVATSTHEEVTRLHRAGLEPIARLLAIMKAHRERTTR